MKKNDNNTHDIDNDLQTVPIKNGPLDYGAVGRRFPEYPLRKAGAHFRLVSDRA